MMLVVTVYASCASRTYLVYKNLHVHVAFIKMVTSIEESFLAKLIEFTVPSGNGSFRREEPVSRKSRVSFAKPAYFIRPDRIAIRFCYV